MERTHRRTFFQGTAVFLGMMGLALGCGSSTTAPTDPQNPLVRAAASVAQVAAAVTGQNAPLADEAKGGKKLWFDTHTFPGEKTMRAWKNAKDAPYSWVGYYVNEVPRMWVASGRDSGEDKAPHEVGLPFAGVWQGMIDVARAVADIKLPVDVNVSNWDSPSDPAEVAR